MRACRFHVSKESDQLATILSRKLMAKRLRSGNGCRGSQEKQRDNDGKPAWKHASHSEHKPSNAIICSWIILYLSEGFFAETLLLGILCHLFGRTRMEK